MEMDVISICKGNIVNENLVRGAIYQKSFTEPIVPQ